MLSYTTESTISPLPLSNNMKTNDLIITLHDSIKMLDLILVQKAYDYYRHTINTPDQKVGWTPLYKAIVYDQLDIIKFLLENGADPNIKTRIGETPLHFACETSNYELIELLLNHKANPNIPQCDGDTMLHIAVKKGDDKLIDILLNHCADPNAKNMVGKTPLHYAAEKENINTYSRLVSHGANPDITDKWKYKPLDLAKTEKFRCVFKGKGLNEPPQQQQQKAETKPVCISIPIIMQQQNNCEPMIQTTSSLMEIKSQKPSIKSDTISHESVNSESEKARNNKDIHSKSSLTDSQPLNIVKDIKPINNNLRTNSTQQKTSQKENITIFTSKNAIHSSNSIDTKPKDQNLNNKLKDQILDNRLKDQKLNKGSKEQNLDRDQKLNNRPKEQQKLDGVNKTSPNFMLTDITNVYHKKDQVTNNANPTAVNNAKCIIKQKHLFNSVISMNEKQVPTLNKRLVHMSLNDKHKVINQSQDKSQYQAHHHYDLSLGDSYSFNKQHVQEPIGGSNNAQKLEHNLVSMPTNQSSCSFRNQTFNGFNQIQPVADIQCVKRVEEEFNVSLIQPSTSQTINMTHHQQHHHQYSNQYSNHNNSKEDVQIIARVYMPSEQQANFPIMDDASIIELKTSNDNISRPSLSRKDSSEIIENIEDNRDHFSLMNNKIKDIFCESKNEPVSNASWKLSESIQEIHPSISSATSNKPSKSIRDWLWEIGLENLEDNFMDIGFKTADEFKRAYQHNVNMLIAELLYKFGIDKVGYRARIMIHLSEDLGIYQRKGLFQFNTQMSSYKISYPSVFEWLESIGYEDYTEDFDNAGYDNLEYMLLQVDYPNFKLNEGLLRNQMGLSNETSIKEIIDHMRKVYEVACSIDSSKPLNKDQFSELLQSRQYKKACNVF